MPSLYVEKLINEVKDKNGDPYFQNVKYTGFTKVNVSDESTFIALATGEEKYDTVFEFSLSMNVKAGNDEEHANTIDLTGGNTGAEEVTE